MTPNYCRFQYPLRGLSLSSMAGFNLVCKSSFWCHQPTGAEARDQAMQTPEFQRGRNTILVALEVPVTAGESHAY